MGISVTLNSTQQKQNLPEELLEGLVSLMMEDWEPE